MWFHFEMFTNEKVLVARGQGTAAMVYEFQKTFIGFIHTNSEALPAMNSKGSFIKLDNLLERKIGEYSGWETFSVDGKFYKFFVERIR